MKNKIMVSDGSPLQRHHNAQHKNGILIRICAFLLCFILISLVTVEAIGQTYASSSDASETLASRLSALREEKEVLDKRLEAMQAEMASAEEELQLVSEQVMLMNQLYSYQTAMTEMYHERVVELRNQLTAAQDQEIALYKSLKTVLRAMEETPKMTFWSVLFGATSMREFLAHISMMNEVIEYEKEQLTEIEKTRSNLAETRYELQIQEANYSESLRELEKQKEELDERNLYLEDLIDTLTSERSNIIARLEYINPQVWLSAKQQKMTQPLSEDEITAFLVRAESELNTADLSDFEVECRLIMLREGLSLVGKVPYFWGGRSYSPGWNDEWNTLQPIQHAGCDEYPLGELFPYGLDCGGFVFWSALTLYGVDSWESPVEWMSAKGATGIFESSHVKEVQWSRKLPGDLVVNSPITHIGFYLCKGDNGEPLYLHCCGGYGVVVSGSILCNFNRAASLDF